MVITENAECCVGYSSIIPSYHRKCSLEGCSTGPSYGLVGTKTPKFCARHAEEGMLSVRSNGYSRKGCTTLPSYRVAGTRKADAEEGMVNVA